ncbi:AraC family transcriptional regulator [Alcanivorax sp. 1008]|uniref:AraC family transcriptional regulator n=1 Tax=Alcanivorax sp. 1008 TaxID=2816853 RepID=UPI001DC8416A|nr:AraC family transcriptional regulator [Alcanivorax sp. 1008]MCC1496581.1 AraC family transcriptional regulator [Alcanivorax sp. 1008]
MTILKMNPDEYSVSTEYAPLLLATVERYGVKAADLLPDDASESDFRDPSARLPLQDFVDVIRRAMKLTGAPWLGWDFGATLTLSSHGFLGYAAMSSETLRDAVELAVKFFRTRTTIVDLQLKVEGDTAILELDELVALNDLQPFVVESLFSSFHFMGLKLLGEVPMDGELRFAFPEPDYYARMKPLIPVPVLFDCAYNQMRFPASRLEQRLRFADPRLARMAEAQCEQEMANIKSPPKLLNQVRRIILAQSGRFPSVDEAASDLHMSSRTLKRKLQQLGTSYQKILDDLRKGLAVEYLTQTEITVDDIAVQLGYSDASNFARAFRRWTGRSPSDYRR